MSEHLEETRDALLVELDHAHDALRLCVGALTRIENPTPDIMRVIDQARAIVEAGPTPRTESDPRTKWQRRNQRTIT